MTQIQVDFWRNQETARHNVATEQQAAYELEETRRTNLVNESIRSKQAEASVAQAAASLEQARASTEKAKTGWFTAGNGAVSAIANVVGAVAKFLV